MPLARLLGDLAYHLGWLRASVKPKGSYHPAFDAERNSQLSANRLPLALRLPSGRITDILNGKRGISPKTALRLARYFGNSARFWMNLQTACELAKAEREIGERIAVDVAPDAT